MALLVVLHLILPLALLAWLAFWPARNWLGLGLHIAAVAAVLAALHLSGLWLMPPWWAIWIYWALLLVAALLVLRRRRERWPGTIGAWLTAVLMLLLTGYAAWTAAQARAGRREPVGSIIELPFPMNQGTYLVVNGGTNLLVSSHARTFSRATPKQRFYHGQSHAVDIVAINGLGFASDGFGPTQPERYEIFGHSVVAPCDGVIVQAANDKPDMRVPIMDNRNMVGNHVLLRCRDADILLAHFQRGSLRVKRGQNVVAGQAIAEAGNSGNSSAPHLHIHAQEPGPPNAPFSSKPLPMTFGGRYLVRGDRVRSTR